MGELLFTKDSKGANRFIVCLHIKTKDSQLILEFFKVILEGRVFYGSG